MAANSMGRLGVALQNSILGPQPAPAPAKPKFFGEGGIGRTLAGIIGDALAQQAGVAPVFAPAMRQRQQVEQEEAQWSRRRQADNEDWMARERWKLQNQQPEMAPMQRDALAWQGMTPELRAAYTEMKKAQEGDPIVTTTLPNGQFYTGPRSGLAAALTGQSSPVPVAPVGNLRPVGGPASAPGSFRP